MDAQLKALNELYYSIYKNRAEGFAHSPVELEKRFMHFVAKGDEAAALETLAQINTGAEKAILADDPLRSAKNSMICCCTLLARAAIQAGVSSEAAFSLSDAVINTIERFLAPEAVFEYERSMVVNFIALVKMERKWPFTKPVRRALEYMDTHLREKMDITSIAEVAQVHPVYLCRIFKEETGKTLMSCAMERKVRESVYFVRHTNFSMADIAALYGFCSQSHYIATFKRFIKITPGACRKRTNDEMFE
ncbi:MAG: AraC family transcriptional regulator [Clostridiales bacterium]|jgi:AraC-like DNA-binding protein|nr:AraC family transcriptional regulator [Clostridiales bacterium]MDR2752221.1 AraC family transcriptional regulator [Clostridiales bacterium]